MFRLFVTDIDGTIFGPRQPISRETKKAVALLRSHGFGVTAATGRNQWEAQRLVTNLGIELPVILANGAQIFDFAAGRLLYGKSFCIQTLTEFLGGDRRQRAGSDPLVRWGAVARVQLRGFCPGGRFW